MNSQIAIQAFDSALSVMAAHERIIKRANLLTWQCSAFSTFEQLLNAQGGYRPSLARRDADTRELGALYDAAQEARGDSRRAFMFGKPRRTGSLIDRRNWVSADWWYRLGNRCASWDSHTRQWIVYTVDADHYQQGAADFYRNSDDLLRGEHCHE